MSSKPRLAWLREAISTQPGCTFPELSSLLRLERAGKIEYTSQACFLTAEALQDGTLYLDARRLVIAYHQRRWTPTLPHGAWTDWSSRFSSSHGRQMMARFTAQEQAFLMYEREHSPHQGGPIPMYIRFQGETAALIRAYMCTNQSILCCMHLHAQSPARGSIYVDGIPYVHVYTIDSNAQLHRAMHHLANDTARHVQWQVAEAWRTNSQYAMPAPTTAATTPEFLTITFRSWNALNRCLTLLSGLTTPWPGTNFELQYLGCRLELYNTNHLDMICLGLAVAKKLKSESLAREILRLVWQLYLFRNLELEHISNGDVRTWKDGITRYLREPRAAGTSSSTPSFIYHPTGLSTLMGDSSLLWPPVEAATLPLWSYLCSRAVRRHPPSVSWDTMRRIQGAVLRGIVQHMPSTVYPFLQAKMDAETRLDRLDWTLLLEETWPEDVLPRGAVPIWSARYAAAVVEEGEGEEDDGGRRRRRLTAPIDEPRRVRTRTSVVQRPMPISPRIYAWIEQCMDTLVRLAPATSHLWDLLGRQSHSSLAYSLVSACTRAVEPRPIISILQLQGEYVDQEVYVAAQVHYLGGPMLAANLLRRTWRAPWVATTTFPQTVLELATLLPLEWDEGGVSFLPLELEGAFRYGGCALQHASAQRRHVWTAVSMLSLSRRTWVEDRGKLLSAPLWVSSWLPDRFFRACMSNVLQLYRGQGCEMECLDQVPTLYDLDGLSDVSICERRKPAEVKVEVRHPCTLARAQLEQLAVRYLDATREEVVGGDSIDMLHHACARQWRWISQCLAVYARNPGIFTCQASNGMRAITVELLLTLPQDWSPARFLLVMLWMRVWGVTRHRAPTLVASIFHQPPAEWNAVQHHFLETWLYTVLLEQRDVLDAEPTPWVLATQVGELTSPVQVAMMNHSISVPIEPTFEAMERLHAHLHSDAVSYSEWLYCTIWMTVLSIRSSDAAIKMMPRYLTVSYPWLPKLSPTLERCVLALIERVIVSMQPLHTLLCSHPNGLAAWGWMAFRHTHSQLYNFTTYLGSKLPIHIAMTRVRHETDGHRMQRWRLALCAFDHPLEAWRARFGPRLTPSPTPRLQPTPLVPAPTNPPVNMSTSVARALIAAQLADHATAILSRRVRPPSMPTLS